MIHLLHYIVMIARCEWIHLLVVAPVPPQRYLLLMVFVLDPWCPVALYC